MTKLTLTEQEELFAKDCKLINLRYEYTNYTGKEKWAVVTELTEKELRKKYPDIIKRYTPFVLLSMAQGEVINEADRNDDKYEKRAKRTLDVYGYSGVGVKKLREMTDSEYCQFVLWNGTKRLIKREKLDKYLAEMYSI